MQCKIIKVSVLALLIGMLGGCADMTQIDAAKAAAAAAIDRANEAYKLAADTHGVALDNTYAISKAQKTADEALKCCHDNTQKMDRMFEKAMMK